MSRAMRKLRLVLLAAAMGAGVALAQPTMDTPTMRYQAASAHRDPGP